MALPKNDIDNLLYHINSSDSKCIGLLYKEYGKPLFHYTKQLIQDVEESHDIVSDTFMKFLKLRQNFDSLNSVSAFLYVTCRNAALDFLRHRNTEKRNREVRVADMDALSFKISDESDILNQMIENEYIKNIYEEINALPTQRRAVIRLLYLEGLSTDEVALHLNLSKQTVLNHKNLALQQLKHIIIERRLIAILILGGFLKIFT